MKNKFLFIVCLLFGLMMINAGMNKIFEYIPVPELPEKVANFMTVFTESGFIYLVALAEIAGGVMVIIPRTRALGAAILSPVIAGILLFHITMEPNGLIMAFIISIVHIWIILENKDKFTPMISRTATD